jgi:hypothetical protein
VPFFYVCVIRFFVRTAHFQHIRKQKAAWEVEESQAPLPVDKATLASETTEDLLAYRKPATPRRRSVIYASS